MKIATLSCSLLGLVLSLAANSAYGQCGCGGSVSTYPTYSTPVASARPAMPSLPPPRMSGGSMGGVPGNVAYVNQLATPVPRANYSLNYAVHLTDGRILLTDFLPAGQTVRGIESQSGAGGRKLNTQLQGTGTIAVTDPVSNSTIATFPK